MSIFEGGKSLSVAGVCISFFVLIVREGISFEL